MTRTKPISILSIKSLYKPRGLPLQKLYMCMQLLDSYMYMQELLVGKLLHHTDEDQLFAVCILVLNFFM